jgi:hypothetical protein
MNLNQVDDVPFIINVAAWSVAEIGAEVVSLPEETLELRGRSSMTYRIVVDRGLVNVYGTSADKDVTLSDDRERSRTVCGLFVCSEPRLIRSTSRLCIAFGLSRAKSDDTDRL